MRPNACVVYQVASKIFVLGQAKTPEGLGVMCEPWIRLTNDLEPRVIGEAAMLAAGGVPEASSMETSPSEKELLRFLEAKSWTAFAPSATSVDVLLREKARVIPAVLGERRAFFPQPDRAVEVPLDPRELGAVILSMLYSSPNRRGPK